MPQIKLGLLAGGDVLEDHANAVDLPPVVDQRKLILEEDALPPIRQVEYVFALFGLSVLGDPLIFLAIARGDIRLKQSVQRVAEHLLKCEAIDLRQSPIDQQIVFARIITYGDRGRRVVENRV